MRATAQPGLSFNCKSSGVAGGLGFSRRSSSTSEFSLLVLDFPEKYRSRFLVRVLWHKLASHRQFKNKLAQGRNGLGASQMRSNI